MDEVGREGRGGQGAEEERCFIFKTCATDNYLLLDWTIVRAPNYSADIRLFWPVNCGNSQLIDDLRPEIDMLLSIVSSLHRSLDSDNLTWLSYFYFFFFFFCFHGNYANLYCYQSSKLELERSEGEGGIKKCSANHLIHFFPRLNKKNIAIKGRGGEEWTLSIWPLLRSKSWIVTFL